jgi:hypothetical protein
MFSRLRETVMKVLGKGGESRSGDRHCSPQSDRSQPNKKQGEHTKSAESVRRSADKIIREHATALKWLADK